jgi:CDP-glucose 4,6-dehydratase
LGLGSGTLENLAVSGPSQTELQRAYSGKRVLVTGHTGFKGSWLTLWLSHLGAEVTGCALAPESERWMFSAAGVSKRCRHVLADIRDGVVVRKLVAEVHPDFVFHLAAQSLVRRSYEAPLETLSTNVIGTAHLLEALRLEQRPCAAVIVTSDKCYENRETLDGYRETDPMGGHDVYSMSKGATELVVSSWRRSFFPPAKLAAHGIRLATGRAGNVVGGGDWAKDRIVPDAINALAEGRPIPVRNPDSVRPWQHVLEPLGGYLLIGARLAGVGTERPHEFCEAWNLGPATESSRPVRAVADGLVALWGSGRWEDRRDPSAPHEAGLLRLSIEKARARLGWSPRWTFEQTLEHTVEWYRAQVRQASPDDLAALSIAQITRYAQAVP